MLFGTTVGQITYSSKAKGFTVICCACGWGSYVKIVPRNQKYAIIECTREECGQVVHVYDNGSSEIVQESKHAIR